MPSIAAPGGTPRNVPVIKPLVSGETNIGMPGWAAAVKTIAPAVATIKEPISSLCPADRLVFILPMSMIASVTVSFSHASSPVFICNELSATAKRRP